MAGRMAGRKALNDTLITIDFESGQADIESIQEIDSERILSTNYSVPIGDTKVFTGRSGRVFLVNAPADATSDYKRIAALERSTVLNQITNYKKIDEKVDIFKYVLLGTIVLMAIVISWGG